MASGEYQGCPPEVVRGAARGFGQLLGPVAVRAREKQRRLTKSVGATAVKPGRRMAYVPKKIYEVSGIVGADRVRSSRPRKSARSPIIYRQY